MTDLELYYIYKTEKGLAQRGLADKPEYVEQLKYENKIITQMGFAGYFLIVQDFIQWCGRQDIYVGPGRGSGAGSLACYCLDITRLDPLEWGLLFERFLNPSRVSMPDLDIDFEKRYRDQVIAYVTEKYGSDYVAHIGTFNMMRAKAAVRSVTRTLGHPYEVGDQLSKLLLPPVHGKAQPLELSLKRVPELHTYMNHKGTTQEEILSWALKVEDTISSIGVHASGVVISNAPLDELVPLFVSKDGEFTTQWEMKNIEQRGLIKFDFLGLKALEQEHICIDFIKDRHGIDIDLKKIPYNDEKVLAQLRAGDTVGVFQLEATAGMRDFLVRMRPTCIADLAALVAIYRPGPLSSPEIDNYLDVRAGKALPRYLVPELKPILESTHGTIIYQEQVMRIARDLCGYSMAEADDLRKAIGKKDSDLMDQHEAKFKEGWIKTGLSEGSVATLWSQIKAFASYAFNLAHAASYSVITYETAWLKTYYPVEYITSVMICEAGNQDDMIKCLAECKKIGVSILPPDINTSQTSFSIDENDNIRFGLGPIKNLGEKPVNLIIENRKKDGPFLSLTDFCQRVDLGVINRLKVKSLIKAGAFDRFGKTRAALLEAADALWEYRELRKAYEAKMVTYERKQKDYVQRLQDVEDGKLSPLGKKLRPFKVPKLPEPPVLPQIPDTPELETHEIQEAEHDLLGFYVSSHPLDGLASSRIGQRLNTIDDVKQMPAKTYISTGAVVTNLNEIITRKKKQKMAFLTLEDLTGSIEAVCFPNTYSRSKSLLETSRPIKVEGVVEVTDTDDDKVSKIIIHRIEALDIDARPSWSGKIKAKVNLMRARDLLRIMNRYSGSVHTVEISLEGHDGTLYNLPPKKIGDFRGAFMRELARIINDE